jgi:signal transduction histidine kinase
MAIAIDRQAAIVARQATADANEKAQRRLLELAQEATHARDDLLAIVSHDLRNPLNVIMMSLDALLQPSERDERRKSRKQLQGIQRAARRMNHLIDDLLDTINIESGRLSVDKKGVELGSLVSEVVETISVLASNKSLNFEKYLPAELPIVLADADRIQQVLGNLLGNAIKFTPQNGTITLRAEHAGSTVIFSVTDTGPGILEADLPHLFERLWKSKSTTSMGMGLGLFIVKGVVESHGGKVWVESKVGHGSTFFFSLPVAATQ